VKIIGISGSIRDKSYNTSAVRAAGEIAAELGMEFEIVSVKGLPFFSEDAEGEEIPEVLSKVASQIKSADALFVSTPEYNGVIPGSFLNALDWFSRDSISKPIADKPIAIMGVSTGGFGTDKAQHFLKGLALHLGMHPLNKPRVRISNAEEKFSNEGNLIDERSLSEIRELLLALQLWAQRLQ
jgi:chromate reductase